MASTLSHDHFCLACGCALDFAPYIRLSPADEICPCCYIQFGYDDLGAVFRFQEMLPNEVYEIWRAEWLAAGCPWRSRSRPAPPHWNSAEQLARVRSTKRYTLLSKGQREEYEAILDAMELLCSHCSLVVRDFDDPNMAVRSFNECAAPHEVEVKRVSEWPGTRLSDSGTAELRRYRISQDFLGVLKRQTDSLFGWLAPVLPEDLCFYRGNGSCLLTTTSHERDAYFDIAEAEHRLLNLQLMEG
jgi:hypothetical protein